MNAFQPGRRGGLRFVIFGFPVRVDPTFFLGALLLTLGTGVSSAGVIAALAGVIFVSVLVHELGHAFAARATGAQPAIELHLIGGLTAYRPPRPLSRLEQIGISLAGPMAGFALAGVTFGIAHALDVSFAHPSENPVVFFTVAANLFWGVVNLLPVLPLDGGMVMQNLIPGNEATRARWAAIFSIVAAAVAAFYAIRHDYYFAVYYLGFLTILNIANMSRGSRATISYDEGSALGAAVVRIEQGDMSALNLVAQLSAESGDAKAQAAAKARTIDALARAGEIDRARWALQQLPGQVPQSSYAFVDAAAGLPHGVTMLDEIVRVHPEPFAARHAILGRVLARRANEVPAYFESLPPSARPAEALREAQYLGHLRGDFANAAQIGETILRAAPHHADAWVMYNTACSWARAGERERAIALLSNAVDRGWHDAQQFSSDPDLSSLWSDPRFHQLRARLS